MGPGRATENTREALLGAMMRKETYATTGPRMLVRFFGGWDFVEADARTKLPADAGYLKGVPMGKGWLDNSGERVYDVGPAGRVLRPGTRDPDAPVDGL